MGLRGPKTRSIEEKNARGETRPCRTSTDVPAIPEASIEPPRGLKGEGLAEWQRVAPLLRDAGVLRQTDLSILEDYCSAFADLRRFELQARSVSPEDAIAKGYQNAVHKLRAQVNALRRELGMTPLSRSSV